MQNMHNFVKIIEELAKVPITGIGCATHFYKGHLPLNKVAYLCDGIVTNVRIHCHKTVQQHFLGRIECTMCIIWPIAIDDPVAWCAWLSLKF